MRHERHNLSDRWVVNGNIGKRLQRAEIIVYVPRYDDTIIRNATKTEIMEDGNTVNVSEITTEEHEQLSCDGWVCYKKNSTPFGIRFHYKRNTDESR